MSPRFTRSLLLGLVAASFTVVRAAPSASASTSTSASVFQDPRLIAFLETNCASLPDDTIHSDKDICEVLRSRDAQKLEEAIECAICYVPVQSATLATTKCGHASHQMCRYKMKNELCHFCRGEGPHEDLNRETILRKTLSLLEEIGWMEPATPKDIDDQKLELVRFNRRKIISKYVNFDLNDITSEIENRGPRDFVPASTDGMLVRARGLFDAAKIAMNRCQTILVRGVSRRESIKHLMSKTMALTYVLELDPELERRFDSNPMTSEGGDRAWMSRFAETLTAVLTEALPALRSRLDHRGYVVWFARVLILQHILATFPCDGYVDRLLVVRNFANKLSEFITALDPSGSMVDIYQALNVRIRAVENAERLPAVTDDQLDVSVITAIAEGRRVVEMLWTDETCVGEDQSDFAFTRPIRDGYVKHLRRSVPYVALPPRLHDAAATILANADTATCVSTRNALSRFFYLLFRGLNSAQPFRAHVLGWMQRLDGLEHLFTLPPYVTRRLRTYGEEARVAEATLFDRIEDAISALKSRIDLAFFTR